MYLEMPLHSSEFRYSRSVTIDTVFHQQNVIRHAHFVLKKKKTEIHFLLQCPVYTHQRRRRFMDPAYVCDTRRCFLSLIKSESQQTILSVDKFLVCAFNLKTSKIVAGS